MPSRRTFQRCLTGTVGVFALAAAAGPARANAADGQFRVAPCESQGAMPTKGALVPHATFGMRIRIACGRVGADPRGLVLSNGIRAGKVKFKSYAALVMYAPPGTVFKKFTWGGYAYRSDCSYELQVWADGPGVDPIKIKNYRAKPHCKRVVAHEATAAKTVNTPGATRVVMRAECYGIPKGSRCSARKSNYLQTVIAQAVLQDLAPPTVAITPDTPLALGQWVNGTKLLNYDASDNVGIRSAKAYISGALGGQAARPCAFADDEVFSNQVPCPNGPGQLSIGTSNLPEGTQALVVTAEDPGGNVTTSLPVTVRIDRTPPPRVTPTVDSNGAWRSTNNFTVAWTNTLEMDRAPIVAAMYTLCPVGGNNCISGQQSGEGLRSFAIQVPRPGQWKLSLWRQDAAGNQDPALASDPVVLRYDPDPPELRFEPPAASDPTRVTVDAKDVVSGIASATIEISRSGSGIWQELPTQMVGGRLVARFDDAVLPAGSYVLRARASDQAHNEMSTSLRTDGQPMTLALPVRAVTGTQAVFQATRTITRHVRRHGRRVPVRKQVTITKSTLRIRPGSEVRIVGRLTNSVGQGVAEQEVTVFSNAAVNAEHAVGVVTTDASGEFQFTAAATSSQTFRLAFAGSPVLLPSQASIAMTVPALTSLDVNRRRLRNGQTVTFAGALRTLPPPPAGKLLVLQARVPKGWETFRTLRTDSTGRWSARYRFTRTFGVQRYRFRVRLPAEAGYPFAVGGSRIVTVVVRGGR